MNVCNGLYQRHVTVDLIVVFAQDSNAKVLGLIPGGHTDKIIFMNAQ